jgi:hypothetical protein
VDGERYCSSEEDEFDNFAAEGEEGGYDEGEETTVDDVGESFY